MIGDVLYRKAIRQAQEDYDKATRLAVEAYEKATRLAVEAYEKATRLAEEAKKAMQSAQEDYGKARIEEETIMKVKIVNQSSYDLVIVNKDGVINILDAVVEAHKPVLLKQGKEAEVEISEK